VRPPKTQLPKVPKIDAEGYRAQLKNALDVARAAYTLTIQTVAVAITAVGALLAIAVEFEIYGSIAVGGLVLFLLFIQVRGSGQALAGIVLAARRLEVALGIDPSYSAVAPVYAAVAGNRRLGLLEKYARTSTEPSDAQLLTFSRELAPFRGGITTTLAVFSSVFLLLIGIAMGFGQAPWIVALLLRLVACPSAA